VLRELFMILSGKTPSRPTTHDFSEMLGLARRLVLEASEVHWGKPTTPDERRALQRLDVELNKLERRVRVDVVTELGVAGASDLPYGLLIMSLIKDVERLGDYAKHLLEVEELSGVPTSELPDDAIVTELRGLRRTVDAIVDQASGAYEASDRAKARALTLEGRAAVKRCNELVARVAREPYGSGVAVHLTLAVRIYMRILGHLLNLLSAVIMPLHKLDYYDEAALLREV